MNRYFLRRTLSAIPTLVAISLVLFVILALAPGDPLSEFANNPGVPPEVRDRIRESLGLNEPILVRYAKWATALFQGDFGYSFRSRSPVIDLLQQRIPTTLFVLGIAYVIAVAVAIPLGVLSAVKQYSWFDNVLSTLVFVGFSLPNFFLAILFVLLFSVELGWLPMIYRTNIDAEGMAGLWERVRQAIMPIAVLALYNATVLVRYTRAAMLETLHQDYARTARAKGLTERRVINGHLVRNALIPVVTVIALGIPAVFSGSIIIEQIFRVPGIGTLLITGISDGDTPVVMAITFIYAVLVIVCNLVADFIYTVLDPRIRYT